MVSREDRVYYEEELRYLDQEAAVFAERFPEIARTLGLHARDSGMRDPHAERIIESFAFLTGKLNRYLNAQYPELVHSLFELIYPQYLQPQPARTIVQFTPQQSMLDKPVLVPSGTELYANGLGPNGERYTFTTCWDLWIQPVELERLWVDPDAPGDYTRSIVLRLHPGADAGALEWDKLEFGIYGDPSTMYELFLQFAENINGISLKGIPTQPGDLELEWSGFQGNHDYEIHDKGRLGQLHLLRDYYLYPFRFFFFRIKGLQAILGKLEDVQEVQVDFRFNRPMATGIVIETKNIRLHACVAQNLYKIDCEPFKIDNLRPEFPVIPDSTRADIEVHSVDEVIASYEQDQETVRPYYHFGVKTLNAPRQWFYMHRRDKAIDRGWDFYIRFIDMDHEGPGALQNQVISIRANCTNRHFAQKLKMDQLNRISNKIPETIQVRNIAPASQAFWPPLHSVNEWDFLAHLALDYKELTDIDALRTLLALYNYGKSEAGARKIQGIHEIGIDRDYVVKQGCCVLGQKMELGADSSYFPAVGDIALFTRVFGHFLQGYCPINSFFKLTVTESTTKNQFHWTAWG
ncbi:type VI secretion system baseplate subunit TssF [Sulfidibacter corallicola]|uniref:Type VI secretion system baseplate subunit TssF n=1 Tax=Sulfidibacter corallicola TaxID=2818388 RepID=A0A8A4TW29_SULCO|nr:type VI secretion system baseplate subunit TssF [Sulfidibacter corallicola]QTD53378.1 type VI secretion system baseplate subunit TssF [Sulfidibacter corallicola]